MTIAASLPTTLSSRQAASSPSAGWKLLAAAAALSASSRQACAFVPSGGRWSATSPGSSVLSRGNGATVDTTLRFACPAAPKSTAAAAAPAAVTAPVGITRRSARVVGERAAGASCRALMSSSIPGGYESSRGLVFPTDKEEGWFDTASVGSPRVHRYLHDEGSRWVMWYHGQDTAWGEEGEGVMDIGTGRIGRAESSDGLTWRRTPGQMPLMSVMDKNTEQWWGFDTAHVGLGDVNLGASSRVVTESSVYFMYYFGGDYEETDVEAEFGMSNPSTTGGGGGGNAPPKGVRLRIGVALSQDGVNWCRIEGEHPTGACIDVGGDGEWDRLFVGWPVVINHREKEFRMYYHSLDPDTKKFTVGMATSQDGMAWQKRGPVFDGGPEGAFDEAGAGRRRVVMLHGVYHMIYEGVNKEGVHALGLATSADGVEWERVGGKPIFERSPSSSGAWDAGGVSNPEIVEIENGDWYLYYTGQSERGAVEKQGGIATSAIGVAMATGDDFTSWTRVEA